MFPWLWLLFRCREGERERPEGEDHSEARARLPVRLCQTAELCGTCLKLDVMVNTFNTCLCSV